MPKVSFKGLSALSLVISLAFFVSCQSSGTGKRDSGPMLLESGVYWYDLPGDLYYDRFVITIIYNEQEGSDGVMGSAGDATYAELRHFYDGRKTELLRENGSFELHRDGKFILTAPHRTLEGRYKPDSKSIVVDGQAFLFTPWLW